MEHARIIRGSEQGFTLIEVLVALAVVTTGLGSVAQLTLVTSRANAASSDAGYAATLASSKLNELQSVVAGSQAMTPADASYRAAPGAFDYLDRAGQSLSQGGLPPGNAVFVRRWSIRPVAGVADPRAVGIEVSVERVRRLISGALADATPFGVVRLTSIQTGVVP